MPPARRIGARQANLVAATMRCFPIIRMDRDLVMLHAFRFLSLVLAATLTTAMPLASVRAGEAVAFSGQGSAGTIVVRTKERRLYFVTAQGRAIRYTVGVGRADKQWFGSTSVASKHIRPAWSPPAEIRRGRPNYVINQARRVIRWALPHLCSRTMNWRSMALTNRARSVALCRGAAFVCTTKISWTSTRRGERRHSGCVHALAVSISPFAALRWRGTAPRAARWRRRDSADAALRARPPQSAP